MVRSIAIEPPHTNTDLASGLIDRFRKESSSLWPAGQRLGVAVSGGPDSMALLALCHAARPNDIEAATIDHGLRAESGAEAQLVADHCAKLGIPHQTIAVTLADGNVQQEARNARYTALESWTEERALDCIATAHHADDQAETLLLRLNRGSGVAGLAGVRREGQIPGGQRRLIRPLLHWRKTDLIAVATAANMQFVSDPSNVDPTFDRARLRAQLADVDWLNTDSIAESAAHLAEADAAITWMTEQEWAGRVRRIGPRYVYRPFAPRVVRLRIVERLVMSVGGVMPRGSAIARLLDRLEAHESGNLAGVLATIVGDAWRFEKEPPRKPNQSKK